MSVCACGTLHGLWVQIEFGNCKLVITIILQIFVFFEKRWCSTFDAFEPLRFEAKIPDIVKQFTSNYFAKKKVLRDVPGMVGDMNRSG